MKATKKKSIAKKPRPLLQDQARYRAQDKLAAKARKSWGQWAREALEEKEARESGSDG